MTRRWPFAVAATVAAAAALVVLRDDAPSPPSAVLSASPSPSPSAAAPGTPGEWTLARLDQPTGVVIAGPSDALLTVDLDTAAEQTAVLPDVSTGAVLPVAAIKGGWLVAVPTCDERGVCGRQRVLYAVRDDVAEVATGDRAIVDPDGRTVWVTEPIGIFPEPRERRHLVRMTFDGKVVGQKTRLEPAEVMYAVGAGGPLVRAEDQPTAPTYVIDPATRARRVLIPSGRVLGVAGERAVWASFGCEVEPPADCALWSTHVPSGAHRNLAALPGPVDLAAVAPSGRYVAVSYEFGSAGASVYDLVSGEALPVNGVTYPPYVGSLNWSPDSGWLVLTHPLADGYFHLGHVVALWRPGLKRALRAPDYPGAEGDAFAVASR